MNAKKLARELDRRGLLGSPVRLAGGRTYGSAATGWYYSLSSGLGGIEDAVLDRQVGYRRRGEAADNVSGPFATKAEALADLAEARSGPATSRSRPTGPSSSRTPRPTRKAARACTVIPPALPRPPARKFSLTTLPLSE